MKVTFQGGPLDGMTTDLEETPLYLRAIGDRSSFVIKPNSGPEGTLYALHFTRRGVAHYYVPTPTERR